MANKVVNASLTTLIVLSFMASGAHAVPPDLQDDIFIGVEGDTYNGNVLGNDSDTHNGDLVVDGFSGPPGLMIDAVGDLTFSSPVYFSGLVDFTYDVREENGDPPCGPGTDPDCQAIGSGQIFVGPVADLPILATASPSGDEDTAIPLGISITPLDLSETVTVTISGLPTGTVLSAGSQQPDESWILSLLGANGATLTPPVDFVGTIAVLLSVETSETVLDHNSTPATATDTLYGGFNVTVNNVNDDPVSVGLVPGISTFEDVDGMVDLAGIVTDVDILSAGDSLTYVVTAINNSAVASTGVSGSVISINVAPNLFQLGGNIVVQVTDDVGSAPIALIVPVDVAPINDPPQLTGTVPPISVVEDEPNTALLSVNMDVSVTDIDIGDTLDYSIQDINSTALASATMSGSVLTVTLQPDESAASGTVTVRARDSESLEVDIVVPVSVSAVNDDPYLDGPIPTLDTDEDVPGSVSIAGIANDVDIVTDGDSLSYSVLSVNNSAVTAATISGTTLSVTLNSNEFEVGGSVTVRVEDSAGGLPLDVIVPVSVNPVNDLPSAPGSVPVLDVPEDSPSAVIDFSGVFSDLDEATGDTLSLAATFDNGAAIFDSITMSLETLTLDFTADANGVADVLVVATDDAGETVPYIFNVTVQSVNDLPFVSGSLSDRNINEDDPSEVISMVGVFDDVDILTNGDALTYEVDDNTNAGVFSGVVIAGDVLTLTLVPDANGMADISIIARDTAGAATARETFTVTINGVDDLPVAADDTITGGLEDGGEIRIDALANDYLGDVPTTLLPTIVSIANFDFIDNNGDILTFPVGTAVVDTGSAVPGGEIVYTPSPDFHGQASFIYTMQDANGDESSAEVFVEVIEQNDVPERRPNHYYSVFEGSTLVVDAVNGLLLGAYDVDPSLLDGAGDPVLAQPLSVIFETAPPPAEGSLVTTSSDGSFSFLPVTDFFGTTTFQYSVFDNVGSSLLGTVSIEVLALPPVGAAPNAGEVAVLYNLANTPLEQSASVAPNVLVTMDDSGSMDWHITVDSTDDNGRWVINNSTIATSSRRERLYTYLYSLNVNSYGTFSGNGRVVPSQESLPVGNDYNVWQARSAAFNNIYYNPAVDYNPWAGLDNANVDFADADEENVRLDPRSASNLYDITTNKSYTSASVPRWTSGGGTQDINVTGFYIPRYYTAAGVRIEIRDNATMYPGGDERDDCAATSGNCTYTEEIQNFANWFQYYRSRELVAKAAIGNVVSELQDIRVGYETINRRSDEPIADMNEYYWEGDKKELLDTIYEVNSSGGTPLRRALDDAGQLLGCTRGDRGCPALPVPEGICQQNFTLLFSDGYWNGSTPRPGNFDQDGAGAFDGGKYADTHSDTLADIAMYYYENDLFTAISDGVPLATSDIDGVPVGTYTSSSDLIHQHMKTFTIAFGVESDIDPLTAEQALATATINWPAPGSAANAKIDDLLHAALNGRGRFLNAGSPQDLQTAVGTAFREFTQAASSSSAAAFNSTSLRAETLLYRGFYDLRNRTGELTATSVDAVGVISDTPTWTAAHLLDADDVDGLTPAERVIFSYSPLTTNGIEFEYNELTPAQQLTLSENQVNFMRGERSFEEPSGSMRKRLDDLGLLGDIVNSSPVFVGSPRAFNRDQRPYPIDDLYSEFTSSVADRRKMVYVGANDGMMHGFDALDGVEVMAYVPNSILDSGLRYTNKLNSFTSAFYLHDYYVDLSPRLNDVYMRPDTSSSKAWMTTLVGGLGAGGKGYFALNVTDPNTQYVDQATAKDSALWEFTASDDTYPEDVAGDPIGGGVDVILDFNGDPVKDLGYSLSLPIVTMSNVTDTDTEKEWVALFGNGTNSTSGIATLFVLFMDKGLDGWQSGDFTKITTGFGVPLPGEQLEGYPNALGSPTAVDRDLNGTVDLVYAGDRLGNLWRFNVEDSNPDLWTVVRLFTATYNDGSIDVLQPTLSKPLVVKHPEQTGFLVTIGTGSFIAEEDGSDTSIQSIYTIWDSLVSSPPTAASNTKATRLVEQTMTNVVDDSVTPAQTRRILSTNSVSYTPETGSPGVYGWYIDLDMVRAMNTLGGVANTDISGQAPPAPQFPGEKAIRRFIFRDGVILTTTVLPSTNATSCFGSRPGALLIFDALTGGDPGSAVIDFNLDGYVDDADLLSVAGIDFSAGLVFDQSQLDGQLVDLSTLGGVGDTDFLFICGGNECISRRIRDLNENKTGRLSWTELHSD